MSIEKNQTIKTLVKVYLRYALLKVPEEVIYIKGTRGGMLIGEYNIIKPLIKNLKNNDYYLEVIYQNATHQYAKFLASDVIIEQGAVIRERVDIQEKVTISMNAVIDIDCSIGSNSTIDMNVVVGSGTIIGRNVFIGAGSVISSVIEKAVIIEDDVFIGAGSIVLPGIKITRGAVIEAGSVVTKDVETDTCIMACLPCKKT